MGFRDGYQANEWMSAPGAGCFSWPPVFGPRSAAGTKMEWGSGSTALFKLRPERVPEWNGLGAGDNII